MAMVGLFVALFTPIEQYETFLYAIGSVFGPLFAILLSDYFVFKKEEIESSLSLHIGALVVWGMGVTLYYQFVTLDLPLGSTLPTMLATSIIFIITKKVMASWTFKSN